MHRKYSILLVIIVIFIGIYTFAKVDFSPSDKEFLLIGSGGISGVYFRVAGQLCNLLDYSGDIKKLDCSVQSTPGSLYNINTLSSGNADLVLCQDDWEYVAYHGSKLFPEPLKDMRLIARLYKEPFTVLARKEANIKVIDDILGKRINIGSPGSGASHAMSLIMEKKGWNKSDFKLTTRLKDVEQSQALCDNKIDVMISMIGNPNGAVLEAFATCDVNFVHLDHNIISALSSGYPYYVPYRIPKEIYKLDEDIQTVAVTVDLIASKHLDYHMAHGIAKALTEKFDYLVNTHRVFSNFGMADLVMPGFIPFHEGARAFYKEFGLLK